MGTSTMGQATAPAPSPAPSVQQPLRANPAQPQAAALLFMAGLAVIGFTGVYHLVFHQDPGYTSGGAAATAGILFVLALVLRFPSLIMDDAYEQGGEPSAMRVMGLSIVLTFCAIMLRTGWNSGTLPSLTGQSQWVWLVTAALGGKATQAYLELQQKKS